MEETTPMKRPMLYTAISTVMTKRGVVRMFWLNAEPGRSLRYEDVIEDFRSLSPYERLLSELYVDELFTWRQVRRLKAYIALAFPRAELMVIKILLPFPAELSSTAIRLRALKYFRKISCIRPHKHPPPPFHLRYMKMAMSSHCQQPWERHANDE
jgi:hypothetical protein